MAFWERFRGLILDNDVPPTKPASGKTALYGDASSNSPVSVVDQFGANTHLGDAHNPNAVRNAGFWFAQRQAPATLTTYSSVGGRVTTADGWGISCENASIQYQRIDTGISPQSNLGNRWYGAFTKLTTTGKMVICQVIEAADAEAFRGKFVRLQMKLKGLGNATWRMGLAQSTLGTIDTVPNGAGLFVTAFGANSTDPTLGTNIARLTPTTGITYSSGTVVGSGINCTLTGNWSLFSAVFAMPTTARNLIVMVWSDSQVAAAAGVAISEVSLTEGADIQAWAPLSTPVELQRAQRYYCKSFDTDTAPAQNAGLAGAQRGAVSVAGAIAGQPIGVRFPVVMRAAPTLTLFNPSAANAFVRNTTASTDATATAGANIAGSGTDVTFTGIAAWTVAQALAVHYTADAEL